MDRQWDCGCVAQIKANKAGTGVLVSPRHVLTCAHTVSSFDPAHPYWDITDVAQEVTVYFPALTGYPEAIHHGIVIRTSPRDLAIVYLETPCYRPHAAFFRPANSWILESPEYAERAVVGFDAAGKGNLRSVTFSAPILYVSGADYGALDEFQTSGGISHGMSGSPLLARAFGATICLGMVYLGGAAVATSRFIAPAAILSFLDELQLDAEFKGPLISPHESKQPDHFGELIRIQRTKRLMTRSEFANRLGVDQLTLEHWEEGIENLPKTAENSVRKILVDGDPQAVDAWLGLTQQSDLIAELRPFRSCDASCSLVVPSTLKRAFVPESSRPTRLPIGTGVQFYVRNLPAVTHLVFIDVGRLDTIPRFYSLIGSGLLSPQALGPGDHFLPERRGLAVEGPPGFRCLTMLGSSEPGRDPWAPCRSVEDRDLPPPQLDRLVECFRSIPANHRIVTMFDYEICSPRS